MCEVSCVLSAVLHYLPFAKHHALYLHFGHQRLNEYNGLPVSFTRKQWEFFLTRHLLAKWMNVANSKIGDRLVSAMDLPWRMRRLLILDFFLLLRIPLNSDFSSNITIYVTDQNLNTQSKDFSSLPNWTLRSKFIMKVSELIISLHLRLRQLNWKDTHTLRLAVHSLRLVECTLQRNRHLREVMKFTLFSPLPPGWISAFLNNTGGIVLHFLMIVGFWCSLQRWTVKALSWPYLDVLCWLRFSCCSWKLMGGVQTLNPEM